MTTTLRVNNTRDIYIGTDGKLAVTSGLTAVMQACEQAASAQLGEMMFAVDRGLPTFATVWNGSPNIPQFEAALRAALLAVADVLDVPSITASASGGVLSYTATIRTSYGEAQLNG